MLDPSFAPGTGMPEAGRLSSRELLRVLRGLTSLNLVSADLVEVARPTTMPRSPRSPPRR